MKERLKVISAMWKDLPEWEKEKYKNTHAQQMKEYNENLTDEDKNLIRNRRENLNKMREKRNIKRYGKENWAERPRVTQVNGYTLFLRDHKGSGDIKNLSEKWKQLSEEEKSVYKEKASELKEKQREVFAAWKAQHES